MSVRTDRTLEAVIHAMLLGPYEGTTAWTATLGCSAIGHPARPRSTECFCSAKEGDPRPNPIEDLVVALEEIASAQEDWTRTDAGFSRLGEIADAALARWKGEA